MTVNRLLIMAQLKKKEDKLEEQTLKILHQI